MSVLRLAPLALVVLLVGCVAPGEAPGAGHALVLRPSTGESLAVAAVEAVPANLRWGDVLLAVNERPFLLGTHADFGLATFEVRGKTQPSDPVVVGDVVSVPAAGAVTIVAKDQRANMVLATFQITVEDHRPPSAPLNLQPVQGAVGQPRSPQFAWTQVADPSGVSYTLHYWPVANGQAVAPPTAVTGLASASYVPPRSGELLPGQTYQWYVRSTDGLGNASPWSAIWEFQTSL